MSFEDEFGEYDVKISSMHSPEHGNCIKEVWKKDGILHRVAYPAITIRVAATRKIIEKQYYLNGVPHRDDGPSTTEWLANGVARREAWQVHGSHHREDGPAFIIRHPETGEITFEYWSLNDVTHRIGKAASVTTDEETGIITEESWIQNGKYYRADGGPVYITRDRKTGEIIQELFAEDIEQNDTPDNSCPDSDPAP